LPTLRRQGATASRRECGAAIAPANVRAALAGNPAALARYERALALAASPNAVECPRKECGAVQEGSAARPAMRCASCGADFCFSHGGAHPGRSCAEFDRLHADEERKTAAALKREVEWATAAADGLAREVAALFQRWQEGQQ
jgi:hypothetical protein